MNQQTYRNQKSALTRAINSGDPLKIIAATRAAFDTWNEHGNYWPDDWCRWEIAESDALSDLNRMHQFR